MIVIAGKNDIAVHGLLLATERFELNEIIVVVNKNDNGIDYWQRSLLKAAKKKGVLIKQLDDIYNINIDCFISLEFDQIIDVNKISTDKIYNMHFSNLPKYKGMYTSIWPILYGDKEAGVTLHKIDSGIDTGDIIAQRIFKIEENDRSQDCYRKYIANSIELLSEWFDRIIDNNVHPIMQKSIGSTYFSKKSIDFKRLEINFEQTAWQIKRQIYAFSFRPYQLLKFNNKNISDILILKEKSLLKPGQIVYDNDIYSVVSTIDYNIAIYYDNLDSVLENIPNININHISDEILKILGVNDRNSKGWSPIIIAAYSGRRDIVEFLLKNGADINDRNYNGTTLLMYAKDFSLKNKDNVLFNFLIQNGANPLLQDWSGKTIFDYITFEEASFLGITL